PIHDAETGTFASWPALGVSNKPMVPTAPISPISNLLHPLRRHIGQPLDSQEIGAGLRAAGREERELDRRRRENERPTTDNGLRPTR
ncbi:MAG: hypothetical protein Q8S73_13985, partial [Deltaproteobacteria bacterium]|nr:hypothetical protein [Myxococcales bacterium]MDP3215212.1 hypothetical protein [Deltaproteobacteria bacterium]